MTINISTLILFDNLTSDEIPSKVEGVFDEPIY
jgi:hypothetical protein